LAGTRREWPATALNRRSQPLEMLPFTSVSNLTNAFRFRRGDP